MIDKQIDVTRCHQMFHNVAKRHNKSQNVTRCRKTSQDVTSHIPGPPLAMCSKTSKSLVTGFPGKAFVIVDTVEKTVDSTPADIVDRILFNLFRYSILKSFNDDCHFILVIL